MNQRLMRDLSRAESSPAASPRPPVFEILPAPPLPRRILFLQTDWEMGMCRVAREMRQFGHDVRKVAFHTSDYYYSIWGVPVAAYRGPLDEWRQWLEEFSRRHRIDTFILYNNRRNYNLVAEELAKTRGITVIVMEQGLVRPLHVTTYSNEADTPETVRELWSHVLCGEYNPKGHETVPPQRAPVSTAHKIFRFAVFAAIATSTRRLFPHYREQQPLSARYHAAAHLRSFWRYWRSGRDKLRIESLLRGDWHHRFFLAPLQVPYDKQVVLDSPFSTMDDFLEEIADSFQRAAPADAILLVKIHPIDRGYREYDALIRKLCGRLGEDRVILVDNVSLDLLIEHTLGVVTINSTVGLTALRGGAPVKPLGNAIYDLPELTFQGSLDAFWQDPEKPDPSRVRAFVRLLESTIQGRGSLARKCYGDGSPSGIIWPKSICDIFGFKQY